MLVIDRLERRRVNGGLKTCNCVERLLVHLGCLFSNLAAVGYALGSVV